MICTRSTAGAAPWIGGYEVLQGPAAPTPSPCSEEEAASALAQGALDGGERITVPAL